MANLVWLLLNVTTMCLLEHGDALVFFLLPELDSYRQSGLVSTVYFGCWLDMWGGVTLHG